MEGHLKAARTLTKLLDTEFKLSGFRFGLDPVIGLVPLVGDAIPLILSLYIVWIGVLLGLPPQKVVQMIFNVAIDFVLGLIPVVGDFSDVIYKANVKNLQIIDSHVPKKVIQGTVLA